MGRTRPASSGGGAHGGTRSSILGTVAPSRFLAQVIIVEIGKKKKDLPVSFLGMRWRERRTVALSLVWNPTSDRTAAGEDRASWALP